MSRAERLRRALDQQYWRIFQFKTDPRHQVERGRMYTASKRVEVPAGEFLYAEFRCGQCVSRIFDLLVSVTETAYVDTVRNSGLGDDGTAITGRPLSGLDPGTPNSGLYYEVRGTELTDEETLNEDLIPGGRGPQAAGAVGFRGAYRIMAPEEDPLLIKIQSRRDSDIEAALKIVWSELDA